MIESIDILGVKVHAVTYLQVIDIIADWIALGGPHQLATANPEFVMAAQNNPEFSEVLGQRGFVRARWSGLALGRTTAGAGST